MRPILTLLALMSFTTVNAYDLVVSFEYDDNAEPVFGVSPVAILDANNDSVAYPDHNDGNGSFTFRSLPDHDIYISYSIGDNQYTGHVPSPVDSLSIKISRDLTSQQLREVEVEAARQYMEDRHNVYMPTERDKKISADGISLLLNMALADVTVSPADNSIKTPAGESYSIFIDYMPADGASMTNIRTKDVQRVEVYDYPNDPRFKGALHVVNFIMVKYEYGGYTKLTGNQSFIRNNGYYGAYSKMSHKSMIYEAGVNYNYTKSRNNRSDSHTVYSFDDIDITRTNTTDQSLTKYLGGNAFVKATYSTGTCMVANTLGINLGRTPYSRNNMTELFDNSDYISGSSSSRSKGDNISAVWSGDYQFVLGTNNTLCLSPSVSYGRFTNNYSYSDPKSTLVNDVAEKAWSATLDASLYTGLGQHSLNTFIFTNYSNNDMDYRGTTPASVNARIFNFSAGGRVNLNFGKVYLSPSANILVSHHDYDGIITTEVLPRVYLLMSYNINSKHRLIVAEWLQYMVPMVNQGGPNIQLTDRIEGISGNPSMKGEIQNHVTAQYQFIPNNNLSFTAYASYDRHQRLLSTIYNPMIIDGRRYMISGQHNNGWTNNWTYGITASYRPVKGLSIRGDINFESTRTHSDMMYDGTHPYYSLQATYSFANVYFTGYYKSKMTTAQTNVIFDTSQYYMFRAGWSNGNLNISVSTSNPFTSSYKSSVSTVNKPNYASYGTNYSDDYHRNVSINISYSFSYGKKIPQEQEASTPAGVISGMLK